MLTCSKCGLELSPAARFCSGCGQAGSEEYRPAPKPGKSLERRITLGIAAGVAGFLVLVGIGAFAGYQAHTQYSAAREAAAIQQIRTINLAETQYFAQFGKYATSLDQLQESLPPTLAAGKSGGYVFTLKARPNGYALNVEPDGTDARAGRNFYTDETMVIRVKDTIAVPATAGSPELP